MSLCRTTKPSRSSKCAGYHRNCDGTVYRWARTHLLKNGKTSTHAYLQCATCRASVTLADVLPERHGFTKQQHVGVKRRRPRYDIKSWKEVK